MPAVRALPARDERLEVRPMGTDALVHDPVHRKVHVLNASAAQILALCDGTRDTNQIAEDMSAQTGQPRERVFADVNRALRKFGDLGIIRYNR